MRFPAAPAAPRAPAGRLAAVEGYTGAAGAGGGGRPALPLAPGGGRWSERGGKAMRSQMGHRFPIEPLGLASRLLACRNTGDLFPIFFDFF